jgi:hypothetical protein
MPIYRRRKMCRYTLLKTPKKQGDIKKPQKKGNQRNKDATEAGNKPANPRYLFIYSSWIQTCKKQVFGNRISVAVCRRMCRYMPSPIHIHIHIHIRTHIYIHIYIHDTRRRRRKRKRRKGVCVCINEIRKYEEECAGQRGEAGKEGGREGEGGLYTRVFTLLSLPRSLLCIEVCM